MPFALSPMPFARPIVNTFLVEVTAEAIGAARRSARAPLDVLQRLVEICVFVERVGDIAVETVEGVVDVAENWRHDTFGHRRRDRDRRHRVNAGSIGNRVNHCLPNPPRCVADERRVARGVESTSRFHEPEVASMNQIERRQSTAPEPLREAHDQLQIRFDELRNGYGILCGWNERASSACV